MRLSASLFSLCLAGTGLAAYRTPASDANTEQLASPVTYKYIVKISEDTDYDAAVQEIEARPGVKVLKKFRSAVFSGVSLHAVNESTVSLQENPWVAQAWLSSQVKVMTSTSTETRTFSDDFEASNYSVHGMTGVDKAHASGVLGKGAKVAIVDTGVDYNHPALGGGFGPGYKVAGGYDLVGDGDWPFTDKEPDFDPIDQMGYGTHVAGIVAGNGEWFKGVAPEATIYSYKVFTGTGYTDDESMIEAFIMAYEDGADIITAGAAEIDGWRNGALATVASRIVDEGVVVIMAVGNSGQAGPFKAGSASNVLSVGSADPLMVPGLGFIATFSDDEATEPKKLAYRPGPALFPTTFKGIPVYPLSLDPTIEDDACQPLPDDTPDLSDKIVLVRISNLCWDYQQAANVYPLRPLGILFYNNDDKQLFNPWSADEMFMGIIAPEAGVAMVETIAAGGNITLDFPNLDEYVGIPTGRGGTPSPFTSWGATWELELKPDIIAPGAEITSTYPTWLGSYYNIGGTSMAANYVAGMAALYVGQYGGRSVHGRGFAKMLQARIMASGSSIPWTGAVADGGEYLASPAQVGTGLVDAHKVLNYTTQLSMARFELNDTHHFSRYHGVDITNNGGEEVIYTFSVQDSGGYDAFESDTSKNSAAPIMNNPASLEMYKLKPNVRFPAGTFRVKPGETREAEFIFVMPDLPEGHKGADMPMVSGKILISGSNGEELSVPYLGMVGDLKREMRETRMFSSGLDWPRITTSKSPDLSLDIWDKPYWGFDMTSNNQDFPVLQTTFVYGVPELRWDIYEAGWPERHWEYPPVPGENGYIGAATFWRDSQLGYFDPADPLNNPDDVIAMPVENLDRNHIYTYMWFGKLANGTKIAPGNYTMRIATLLPFGNREASDNWNVVDLPEVMILPAEES